MLNSFALNHGVCWWGLSFYCELGLLEVWGLLVDLWRWKKLKYKSRLSLDIPLWTASHGFRIDALLPQSLVCTSPLAYSLIEWFTLSCSKPRV